jgi:serine/threonine protein kinase
MDGGRMINKGTYGCIFDKPLLCKNNEKQLPKGKLGKITDTADANTELLAYTILHPINESKDYFILPDKSCMPSDNQADPDITKCLDNLHATNLKNMKQISMPFGGISLTMKANVPFFVLMKHLLEAGSLMLLNGFVHYDIYSNNIVIDKFGIPRIIDYGQSFAVKDISLDTIKGRWKELSPKYAVEPPEVTLLTAIDDNNRYTAEEAISEVMPNKRVFYTIEKLLGVSVKKQIMNLVQFAKESQAFQNSDLVKLWKLYYPGFDSWSIGVILLEYLDRIKYSYEFLESAEWKLKRVIVTDILKKMLHTNPKERIDCVEALNMFDPFNDIYTTYGVEWLKAKKIQRRKA